MANTLRFKRGLVSGIPTALAGEPLFTTDTFDLYIGNGTTNTRFQKYIASGTTSQLLRGDGSLLTMPIVLTSPSNGQVLKYNGTSWVNDSDAGITGSGTTNFIPKFTGATTLGNSNITDDGTTVSLISRALSGTSASFSGNVNADDYNMGAWKALDWAGSAMYIGGISASQWTAIDLYTSGTFKARLDASGNLGLGVTPSAWRSTERALQIGTYTSVTDVFGYSTFGNNYFVNTSSQYIFLNSARASVYSQNAGVHAWSTSTTSGTAGNTISFTQAMTLTANGRLLLGTTTEGTQRLQVAGQIYVNGATSNTYIAEFNQTNTTTDTSFGLVVRGGTSVNDSAFRVQNAAASTNLFTIQGNGSVGIGTTSLTGYGLRVAKNIEGALSSTGIYQDGTVQSGVTSNAFGFYNSARTQAATFTLTNYYHFFADQFTLGAGSVITNQYGFFADNTLAGATNDYGFYGNIASGTGRWNFYAGGSAANYFNGNTIMGTLAADSGEKLQVNGTMKVTGASTFGATISVTGVGNPSVGRIELGTNAFKGIFDYSAVSGLWYLNNQSGGGSTTDYYQFQADGTAILTMKKSGAATFSSSVTAASLNINAGTQLSGFRGSLSSPNAGQIYYATDNSGWQLSIGKLVSTTYTAQMVFKDNATVTTTSDFILAGGYGLDFINGSGTTVTAMRSTAGGASILSTTSTGTHIVVGTEVAGDFILASNNTERIRLSSSGFFSQLNATNPSSSVTDSYIQYSADVVAGNAAPHFRTENGAVVKLYQETTGVGNAIFSQGGGNAVLDDSTFDGYTLRQIVKALRNQGILQ